jgi:hypothetical protein
MSFRQPSWGDYLCSACVDPPFASPTKKTLASSVESNTIPEEVTLADSANHPMKSPAALGPHPVGALAEDPNPSPRSTFTSSSQSGGANRV